MTLYAVWKEQFTNVEITVASKGANLYYAWYDGTKWNKELLASNPFAARTVTVKQAVDGKKSKLIWDTCQNDCKWYSIDQKNSFDAIWASDRLTLSELEVITRHPLYAVDSGVVTIKNSSGNGSLLSYSGSKAEFVIKFIREMEEKADQYEIKFRKADYAGKVTIEDIERNAREAASDELVRKYFMHTGRYAYTDIVAGQGYRVDNYSIDCTLGGYLRESGFNNYEYTNDINDILK